MRSAAILVLVAVAACGGKPKPQTTPDDNTGGGGSDTEKPPDTSSDTVPSDKMDEINRSLARKRETVSRCLAFAVDNKELPKGSKGKITLEIIITGGKAN